MNLTGSYDSPFGLVWSGLRLRWTALLLGFVLVGLVCALWFRSPADSLVALFLVSLLALLARIDAEWFVLPDVITLPGILIGLATQPWTSWSTLAEAATGAIVGGTVLWLVVVVSERLRGTPSMGLGDAKMLALLGAFLGWKGALLAFFVACVSGSVFGLAAMARSSHGLQARLPFGVFLAVGGVSSVFFFSLAEALVWAWILAPR